MAWAQVMVGIEVVDVMDSTASYLPQVNALPALLARAREADVATRARTSAAYSPMTDTGVQRSVVVLSPSSPSPL